MADSPPHPALAPAPQGTDKDGTLTSPVPEAPPGLFAGRYRPVSLLGRGAHGEVWSAEDRVGGGECALKLIDVTHVDPARVRREIAALRLLRLPGVARLIDEGNAGGRAFLAMERVDGAPFPGVQVPSPWPAVLAPLLSLLEVLSRVHAAGVVHRDLKPPNVLVTPEGRACVLDFGISAGSALGQGLTVAGQILGTPAYLAPEQIRGDPVSPATDLYAVGAMLYQALSGRLPHEAESVQALLRARLTRPPPPLRALVPDLPAAVSALVTALLAEEPEDRPASAAEVIARLSGRGAPGVDTPLLPRLGPDTPLLTLTRSLREGQSRDLVGPPGSGRTRCLREAVSILRGEGRTVVELGPGTWAFDSLDPLAAPALRGDGRLRDVEAAVDAALAEALSSGAVLVADDAHRLDHWSLAALDRARSLGAVALAWSTTDPERAAGAHPFRPFHPVEITPLSEADLLPLFTGPERIFHLPSDAARALFERTEGIPSEVDAEVRAWIRAGLARPDGPRIAVDRDSLDRLASGLGAELRPGRGSGSQASPPHLRPCLSWIAFAAPNATADLVAEALRLPLWRAEEAISDLAREGLVGVLPSGRVVPRGAVDPGWAPAARREAHRTLARLIPPGAERRLLHLLAGEESAAAVAAEASHVAARLAREGAMGKAITVLSEGLLAARRTGGADACAEEEALLSLWTEIAMEDSTAHALDKVLYEISRSARPSPALDSLGRLVRAMLAALTSAGERALEIALSIPPFDDPVLERRRLTIAVLAARRGPITREEAVVDEAAAWAALSGDPRARVAAAGWLGRLRYRQDRFDEAAALHAEAAEGEEWVTARIAALLRAASALLEALRLDEARQRAAAARDLAERCRNARYEARAEWLLRAVAYRMEYTLLPDHDLCDLAGKAGVVELEAFVCLNEAAVAFRAGQRTVAADLASRAERVWEDLGKRPVADLARALAVASGRPATPEEVCALASRAAASPVPVLGLQALGLLALARPAEVAAIGAPRAPALAAVIPERHRASRLEVLSVNECLDALAGAPVSAMELGTS